jgi:hypothetical protein
LPILIEVEIGSGVRVVRLARVALQESLDVYRKLFATME